MPYFKICPTCGAHLDPSEICDDCKKASEQIKGALPAAKQVERPYNRPPERIMTEYYHGSLRPSRERSNI